MNIGQVIIDILRGKTFRKELLPKIQAKFFPYACEYPTWECYRKPSKKKWEELKDAYKGERCFIVGAAPSIKLLDLSKLNQEYTFVCNKSFELKKMGLNKGCFYVIGDRNGYEEFGDKITSDIADYFFISTKIPWDKNFKNEYFFKISNAEIYKGYIHADLTKTLPLAHTIVATSILIAKYLGFSEIIVIGVDMDYSGATHCYSSSKGENERKPNEDMQLINLKTFEVISKYLQKNGIKIYNASPKGRLNCMERKKYNDFFYKDLNKD